MKKKSTIIIIFSLGLIIALFPHVAKYINEYLDKQEVSAFHEIEMPDAEIKELMEKSYQCNQEIYNDTEGFRDPFARDEGDFDKFKQCFDLLDGEMFAAIEIPRLELVIPIYLGATDEILNKGIGQVEGSSLPVGGKSTHTVLAGHRGMALRMMFRDVEQVLPGDKFYIHTFEETLVYEVYEQKVIYPEETEHLEIIEDRDLATLLTCHPYRHNYQRLLIMGERVE